MEIISNSMFPTFLSIFCIIYIIGYFGIFRNWSQKIRPEASSCLISLFHGSPAVILAISALRSQPVWGFASPNSSAENGVLEFSIAYFTMDLIHYLIFTPQDYLFIAHHLATLFVFITCRCVTLHGAFSVMVLLVFAEITSFCQNIWTLAGLRKDDSELARRVYWVLSPPFYALYTAMRVVAGPLFFAMMSASLMKREARDVMPIWISISWIVVVGTAIMVSWLWIWNNWTEYFRARKASKEKKEG
ncbi:hypothetical protein LUZ61_005418 [Rhynchospora tenuis]|uniref:TLC domain-containing protein n=1 Tax=Rhynchospora tenuis TaxID=198213 RepID=A0AAD6EUM5_9POAL|nr:hypothetical protein LUZ61_005418 [Rhynchospora tenuis]